MLLLSVHNHLNGTDFPADIGTFHTSLAIVNTKSSFYVSVKTNKCFPSTYTVRTTFIIYGVPSLYILEILEKFFP